MGVPLHAWQALCAPCSRTVAFRGRATKKTSSAQISSLGRVAGTERKNQQQKGTWPRGRTLDLVATFACHAKAHATRCSGQVAMIHIDACSRQAHLTRSRLMVPGPCQPQRNASKGLSYASSFLGPAEMRLLSLAKIIATPPPIAFLFSLALLTSHCSATDLQRRTARDDGMATRRRARLRSLRCSSCQAPTLHIRTEMQKRIILIGLAIPPYKPPQAASPTYPHTPSFTRHRELRRQSSGACFQVSYHRAGPFRRLLFSPALQAIVDPPERGRTEHIMRRPPPEPAAAGAAAAGAAAPASRRMRRQVQTTSVGLLVLSLLLASTPTTEAGLLTRLRLRRTSNSSSGSSRKKASQSSTTSPSSSHPLSSLLPVPFVLLPSSPIGQRVARLQEDGRRSLASASQAFEVGFKCKPFLLLPSISSCRYVCLYESSSYPYLFFTPLSLPPPPPSLLQSLAKRRVPSTFDRLVDELDTCMDSLAVSLSYTLLTLPPSPPSSLPPSFLPQSLAKKRVSSAFDRLIDELDTCMDSLAVSLFSIHFPHPPSLPPSVLPSTVSS